MKQKVGQAARRRAPTTMAARDSVLSVPELWEELRRVQERCAALEEQVRRLDADLDESRALNRRAAELLDAVVEHVAGQEPPVSAR
jgi:uncharacterized small protein (DUF1192 family)